jgi:hypothetical protein
VPATRPGPIDAEVDKAGEIRRSGAGYGSCVRKWHTFEAHRHGGETGRVQRQVLESGSHHLVTASVAFGTRVSDADDAATGVLVPRSNKRGDVSAIVRVFKKFILIYISKKKKSLIIATRITCLIYMVSMHFSHRNSMNPFIHAKHVECDYFPLLFKFNM